MGIKFPAAEAPMNEDTDSTHDMSREAENERGLLQAEIRRLEARLEAQTWELNLLRARFARYEAALRASQVAVYTQDRELRYTSISSPFLGHSAEDILGHTDEELLPAEVRASVIGLKREVLATGAPQRMEVAVQDGKGMRWHDLHVDALRNDAGEVVGLTCAAVDMTERKEGEAHLRLLLRELTHRSKNLLAVIQAMARQTARHAGSIEAFLDHFGARLQALAASHDLLVRENWHGASVNELVRSQLAMYMDRGEDQVTMDGPSVALTPEAAQNLGLALHELAVNAARFGALSVPDGHVSVTWHQRDGGGDQALELDWRELHGPSVKPRRKRGFGSMVIERNLARALDAEVDLAFDPEGLRCRVIIPANQILTTR